MSNFPSPEEILSKKFVAKYKDKQPDWGFNGLGYVVYKRTYARKLENEDRTEEWYETVERCIRGSQKIGANYTKEEAERLYDHVFNLRCNFAGRALWQLNTDTVDKLGANSLINCFYTNIAKIDDFLFLFENSMLGGGVGFSVRREDVHELPRVKAGVKITHETSKDADFIVPDSREGWSKLIKLVLKSYFYSGRSFSYSTILIRGKGEAIRTFGGTASGPQILIDGIADICKVLEARVGKKVRSTDALDICNILGKIVVSGNVRRSAELALGDTDDTTFLKAKRWDSGEIPNWRAMSNNSVYCSDINDLLPMFWEGYKGNGEPYGLFNLKNSKKYGRIGEEHYDATGEGANPSMPAGTLVGTADGIFPIEELENEEFYVKSLDGKMAMAKCFLSSDSAEVLEISFGKNKKTHSTKQHKWPVLVDGKIIKKTADKLAVGDLIPMNRNEDTGINGNPNLTEDEGFLLGILTGDGWFSQRKNGEYACGVVFSKNETDQANRFLEILNKNKRNKSTLTINGNALYVQFTDFDFCDKLKNYYGLKLSKEKGLPDVLFKSNDKFIKGFIDGLYSSDGTVDVSSKRLALTTSRYGIAEGISKLLSFYGVKTRIAKRTTTSTFPNKKNYNKKYTRYDVFVGIGYLREFNNIFKITNNDKQNKINSLLSRPVNNNLNRQLTKHGYEEIKSVKSIGNDRVWDITVYHDQHVFPSQYCYTGNCVEIVALADKETCNLSEIYLNNITDKETFLDCAELLYKYQKAVCALPYYHAETEKIVHKNMRIGVGVTGICQNHQALEENWFDFVYKRLKKLDISWSKSNNHNESIRLTTIKPSGTLSLLAGSTPGVHPAYSKFYIRRVRMSSQDKLVEYCRERGFKVEFEREFDGTDNPNTVVVEFPCESGEKAIVKSEMSAVKQLDLVKRLQKEWADNSVSVTVYYKKDEIPEIQEWLKQNWNDHMKTCSFLLHEEHGFEQAPYEEITEEQYQKIKSGIKDISIFKKDTMIIDLESDCDKGACPIR